MARIGAPSSFRVGDLDGERHVPASAWITGNGSGTEDTSFSHASSSVAFMAVR
jgi:hypothetical protein